MRKTILLAGMLCVGYASAQETKKEPLGKVGINTPDPKASLEVSLSENNRREEATTNEGLLIPRISKVRTANMESPEKSTLIYVNATDYTGSDERVSEIKAEGFYFFDGAKWRAIASGSASGNASGNASGALTGNIGINQPTPVATLDIQRANDAETAPAGLLLPRLSQEQRNKMTKENLTVGLQIFNTDKNCIDWWNGRYWLCTDGSLQDGHGATASFIEEFEHTETRKFFKNNCPAGFQSKDMYEFTGSAIGRGVAQQKQDAIDKAKENARLAYYKLGQDYANANGECIGAPTAPATDAITLLDQKLQIGNTKYWFSSIYDKDYLASNGDVIMPTTPASWQNQNPIGEGTNEQVILDVQGVIRALNSQKDNAIDVSIPITTPPSVTLKLPGFTTYLEIPAEYTEDGRKGVVVFTWEPTTLQTSTKFFKATIYAKDADINLKKLDLAQGLGSDHMGLSLGVFKYPINASDNDPKAWKGELDLRLISAIPDKRFNIETTIGLDTKKRHQFLYVPSMGPDGKIWLNNNLGADYANIHKSVFNPGQQAKTYSDHFAYGSLFQWGRVADGHELMTWGNGTSQGTNSTNYPTYQNVSGYNWNSDESSKLTQFNENCPDGWHTPQKSEFDRLASANTSGTVNISNTSFFVGGLRVPYAGYRNYNSGSYLYYAGGHSHLWSRTEHPSDTSAYGLGHGTSVYNLSRSYGFALRCLKD